MLAALARLNADLGTTVVLAEHRLDRAAPLAHHVVRRRRRAASVALGRSRRRCSPSTPARRRSSRSAGCSAGTRCPLTVRDAAGPRGVAEPRHPGADRAVEPRASHATPAAASRSSPHAALEVEARRTGRAARPPTSTSARATSSPCSGATARARPPCCARSPGSLDPIARRGRRVTAAVAYVPQNPNALLFSPTVRRELEETLRLLGRPDDGAVDRWLDALDLTHLADRHPRSLAGGERQRVAIAAVAVGGRRVLLLDEPTRGMDAASRRALHDAVDTPRERRRGGRARHPRRRARGAVRDARASCSATATSWPTGRARDVLAGSLFAPQVLRVLPPFLTVAEVEAAGRQTIDEVRT